ncbi:MOSC domain-containing protein [Rhodopseudomonas sp. HC1]|uniref:MOSC domain-containing protein n=1 Tax=Rhodopseudomonas infernalis TaxID=2897386 RepID=UPI001EE78B4C|nr:MOSC domain-containing protein [Rhodopseudomonas infernalis]MCG6204408.1 MOSC domain-containing protein [Rhodopseudomonas infernalis]
MTGLSPDTPLGRLIAAPMRPGLLTWIGLRPARHAAMTLPEEATLIAQTGIVGDRYRTTRDGARQVTLIAAEDLAAIAAFLGRDSVAPELLRRNLVTRGINLVALKGQRFRIGAALLEGSGECAPCSKMEATFGVGGYNAIRGRGGITARVVEGGTVRIGDPVERV